MQDIYGAVTDHHGVDHAPVVSWATRHSTVEYKGKYFLFYHDSVPSGGKT